MGLGSGQFVYEEDDGWGEIPSGWEIAEVPGVAVDSQDRVYAFCRSEHPIIVFDREGRFLRSWGEGLIKRAHDIIVGPDDSVYCVDDWGHAVHKFTTEGELLMTIETADSPADTGYDWDDHRIVERAGPAFQLSDRYCADVGWGFLRVGRLRQRAGAQVHCGGRAAVFLGRTRHWGRAVRDAAQRLCRR